jgi:hypothetical protein
VTRKRPYWLQYVTPRTNEVKRLDSSRAVWWPLILKWLSQHQGEEGYATSSRETLVNVIGGLSRWSALLEFDHAGALFVSGPRQTDGQYTIGLLPRGLDAAKACKTRANGQGPWAGWQLPRPVPPQTRAWAPSPEPVDEPVEPIVQSPAPTPEAPASAARTTAARVMLVELAEAILDLATASTPTCGHQSELAELETLRILRDKVYDMRLDAALGLRPRKEIAS